MLLGKLILYPGFSRSAQKGVREEVSKPLYILDGAWQKGRLRMPHMSEDVEILNGKVLVCFESAAKKMAWGFIPCSIANVMVVPLP